MELVLVVGGLIFSVMLHHIIHELSHVVMAKSNGVAIIRIHWFTYSKIFGTRVFYENEPSHNEVLIDKKWGWIASAGFLSTTLLGYLFFIIYLVFKTMLSKYLLLILVLLAVVFIISDSFYFFIGILFNFGDIIGIKKAFGFSKMSLIMMCTLIFIINVMMVNKFLW
ncbi:MAG: hypothetical protein ACRCST_01190, partial [Turicibacter sp.]